MMRRFFQRIREKARDVAQKPIVIVALGDSVTQGVMEHRLLDGGGVYHRLFQEELELFFPSTTFSTINAGVSGGTAGQAIERLERDVLRHEPDLVLIAFGLNDSLGGDEGLPGFQAALKQIIGQVRAQTTAAVMLLTPPFMATRRSFRIHPEHDPMADKIIRAQTEGMLGRYAEAIRSMAEKEKTALADIHRAWRRLAEDGLDTDLWLINGLNHPDRRGHEFASRILFHTMLSQMPEMGASQSRS